MTLVKTTNGFYPTVQSVLHDFLDTNWGTTLQNKMHKTVPAVNIQENDNAYVLTVAAAGYSKNDFQVTIDNEVLTIKADIKKEESDSSEGYSRREFFCSSFERRFQVPRELIDSDRVEASYENGILQITIPKLEEKKVKIPKTIEIQ